MTISVMVTGSIPFIKDVLCLFFIFPVPFHSLLFPLLHQVYFLTHCSYFYVRQKCMLLVCKEELNIFIVIISLIIKCLRIQPVHKLPDLISLIIHGSLLCTHFSVAILHSLLFTMEDLDSRLFITDVEVSCCQDQLKQAVSIYCTLSLKLFLLKQFFSFGLSILCID